MIGTEAPAAREDRDSRAVSFQHGTPLLHALAQSAKNRPRRSSTIGDSLRTEDGSVRPPRRGALSSPIPSQPLASGPPLPSPPH
jgi:hypothetical protein